MYSTQQQKDYPLENSNQGATRTFLDQIKLSSHIIYLTNDGWSWNLGDQLKDNKRLEQEQDVNELFITQPIELEGIKNSKVVKLQANRTVQIALTESGKVYVKGSDRNSTGILGLGEDVQESREFKQIAAFQNKKIKQISLGLNHAAAIDDSDNLYIWGSGSNGQLAKVNSSTESVKEMSFSLPSRVELEEMINNVKDVICNHTSTTVLTKNGLIFILGEYTQLVEEKDQAQEIKQIWSKSQSQKDVNKQQAGGANQKKQQEGGSPKLNSKKKQKNQIQYSWQTFVKVITQGEWGGCALTKKGDIVFFNKFFQTEKLGGKSQFTDVFANKEKMFALQSDSLLEWDFGFILKNGFFQNNKRTNIDRKLDVKFYPPKIHQFTQSVKQAKLVLSQNNSQVALNVETDGGDVFVEKNNIFSQNRQRNNSDLSNKLNSSYMLNASQNRLNNINQSMFSNNLPRGLQSPSSFLGTSGEYKHNFFSPESSDVYQKFLAAGNNANIATLPYSSGKGFLGTQNDSGKKSYLNFGLNTYRNNNMNDNHFKQNNLAGADFEKRINQEMRRLNQNTYIPQMHDKSIDYQGKRVNTDESYMFEELQLPSRLKTLTDLHTQIGSHFRERVHEVQSTINKTAYNKRHGFSPLKNNYQNQETINPSRSKLRIESYQKGNQQVFESDEQGRVKRSKLMTAGEFDQKWKELNRKSQSKGKHIQTYKSSKDLNYFLQLIQSGKSHFDLYEKNHHSTPPKGNRDTSFFANTKYGYNDYQRGFSPDKNNNWSPLTISREQYNQLKQQKASFLQQWQSAGNDKFKQEQVLKNNNQFIDNWMNFNNYYDNQNKSSSNLGNSYYDDPYTGSLLSKSRSNPFYQNFQQQIHANDKLNIFGGLGEGKYNGGFARGASNNRQVSSHHRNNSSNLNHSISALSGSQLNIGSRNQLKQIQFIDANGMKIKLPQNQPIKSKNNLNESVISGRSNNKVLNDSIHAASERKIRMLDNKNDFEKQWDALNKSRDKSREEYLNRSQKSNSRNNSFYSDQKANRSRSNSNTGSQRNFDKQNNSSIAYQKQVVPSSFLGGLQDPTQRGQSYFDALKPINTEGLETNSVFSSKPHGLPKYNQSINNSKNLTNQSKEYVPYQGDHNFQLDFNQLGSHNNQSPRFHQNRHQYIQNSPERLNRSYDPNLSNSYQQFKSRRGSFGLESEEQDLNQNKSSFATGGNFSQNRNNSTERRYKDLQSQFESQLSENQKLKDMLKKQEEQDKRANKKTAERQKSKKDGNTVLTEGSMNLSSSENEQGQDDNIDPSLLSKEELSKRQRREERALQQKQKNNSIPDIQNDEDEEQLGFEFNNSKPQNMQKSLRQMQPGRSHSNISDKDSQNNIPQESKKIKKIVGYDKNGKAILEIVDEEDEDVKRKNNKDQKQKDRLSEKIVGYEEDGTPVIEESSGKIVQKVIGQDENGQPITIDVFEDDEDSLKKSKRKQQPGQENVIQKVVGFDDQGRPIIQEIVLDQNGNQQNINTRGFLSKDEVLSEPEAKLMEKIIGFDQKGKPIVQQIVAKVVKKVIGYDKQGKPIIEDILIENDENGEQIKKSQQLTNSAEPAKETFQKVVGYDSKGRPIVEDVFVDEDGVLRSVKNTATPKDVSEKIIGYDKKGKPIVEQIQAKIVQQVVGYDRSGNPIVEEILVQETDPKNKSQQGAGSQPIQKIVGYDKNGKPIVEESTGKILSKVVGYDKQGRPIVEEIFVDDEDLKKNKNKGAAGNDEDDQLRVIQKVIGYDEKGRPIVEKVVLDQNQDQKPEYIQIEQIIGYDNKGNPIVESKAAQIMKQIVGYDAQGNPIIQDVLEYEEDIKKRRPGMDNSQTFQKVVGYDQDGKPIIEESQGKIIQTIVGYDKNGQPLIEEIFVDNNDLKAKNLDEYNPQSQDRVVQKVVGYDKQGRPLIEKVVISNEARESPKIQKMQKVVGYDDNGNAVVKNTKAQITKQVVGYDSQGNPIIEEVLEDEQAVLNKRQGIDQSKTFEKIIGYDINGKPIVEVSQGKIIQQIVGYDEKGRPIIQEVFVDNKDLKQSDDVNKSQSRIVQNVVGYDKDGRPLIEKVIVNQNKEETPKAQIIQKVVGYDGKGQPIIENTKAQITKQIIGYDQQGNPIIEEVLEDEDQIKKNKKGLDNGQTVQKIIGYDQNGEPIVELSQGKIIQRVAGYDENGRPIIEEIFIDNKDLVQQNQNLPRVIQKVVGYDQEGRPLIEKIIHDGDQQEEHQLQRIQKVIGYDENGKLITKNTVAQISKQIVGYDSQGNPIIEEVLQDEEEIKKRKPGFDNGQLIEKIVGYDSNGEPIIEISQGKIIQKIAGYDEKGRPIIEEIFVDNKDLQQKEKNVAAFIDQGRVVQKVIGYDANGRPIIQKTVVFNDPKDSNQSQYQTLEKVIGVDQNGKPIIEKVQGKITKQLIGYDSQGRPIVEEILEDQHDLKRKAAQNQTIQKVVGYDKNDNPIIEEVKGKIVQKVVGYDDQGRAIVEEIIIDEDNLKKNRSKSNQKGRYINKIDHYDEHGRPVVQKVFVADEEASTAPIHSVEKVIGINEKGEPIIVKSNATITKQFVGYDNQGNKVFADVLVDDNKKAEQDQVQTIQKIVGFDKKGKPIVEQVLGKIVQQVVGYDDEGRPIVEEILIDQDELKKSKNQRSQEGGRYVQKVVSYDENGRPIIEKILVNDQALAAVTPPVQVFEKVVGVDSNGDPIIVKSKACISKQIVGYDQNGNPIFEDILEDEDQIKRKANQQGQGVQAIQKVIGYDKNGEPITEECIAKIVQKVVGYDDSGRPIVEQILIEESDIQKENNLNDQSVRIIQKVVGFDNQGRPIVEKIVVDNGEQQGKTVEKPVNKKIVYDQNGKPKLVASQEGKITKQIVGYDDFGVPVIEEILEDQNSRTQQPQIMEKIIAYDKNGNPIIEQCLGKIVQQVVGYDKNGIPIIQEVLIDEEDLKRQDLVGRGSASTNGRIMQKVVGYDNQGRPIIERIYVEQDDRKNIEKGKKNKSNFLQQDEEEIASDFDKKRQNASKNNSLNKSQPINFDLQEELESQLRKEIEDLSSRHSDLKKSQNLTYSSIDHNLSQSPEKKRNKDSALIQQEKLAEEQRQQEEMLKRLQQEEMEQQRIMAEQEQLQKIQQLEKQKMFEKQQQIVQRLSSQTPKSQKNNNSLRLSQEVKKNKSNINLDNSRGSLNNSRSNTPKSNSLRFSDICNNFNNQMKKTHLNEQTKALERNTGLRISQYADQNRSRSSINNSRGSMNNSNMQSKSPVNTKKSMFSPFPDNNKKSSNDILPDELKNQPYHNLKKSQESINKSFNEVSDPNFIKSPISPILPPSTQQQKQKAHFFGQAASIASAVSPSNKSQGAYLNPNTPSVNLSETNFEGGIQQQGGNFSNTGQGIKSPFLSPINRTSLNSQKQSIDFKNNQSPNNTFKQQKSQNLSGAQNDLSPSQQKIASELSPSQKPPIGQQKQPSQRRDNEQLQNSQNTRDSQNLSAQSPSLAQNDRNLLIRHAVSQQVDQSASSLQSSQVKDFQQQGNQKSNISSQLQQQQQQQYQNQESLQKKGSQDDLRSSGNQLDQYYHSSKQITKQPSQQELTKQSKQSQDDNLSQSKQISQQSNNSTKQQKSIEKSLSRDSSSPITRQQTAQNAQSKQNSIKEKDSNSPSSQMKLSGTYSLKQSGDLKTQKQPGILTIEDNQEEIEQSNSQNTKQNKLSVQPIEAHKRQSFGIYDSNSNDGNLSSRKTTEVQQSPVFNQNEQKIIFAQDDQIEDDNEDDQDNDRVKKQKYSPSSQIEKQQSDNNIKQSQTVQDKKQQSQNPQDKSQGNYGNQKSKQSNPSQDEIQQYEDEEVEELEFVQSSKNNNNSRIKQNREETPKETQNAQNVIQNDESDNFEQGQNKQVTRSKSPQQNNLGQQMRQSSSSVNQDQTKQSQNILKDQQPQRGRDREDQNIQKTQNISRSKSPSSGSVQNQQINKQDSRENPTQNINKQRSKEYETQNNSIKSSSKSPQNNLQRQQLSKQASNQDTRENPIQNISKQRSNDLQSKVVSNLSRSKSPSSSSDENQQIKREKSLLKDQQTYKGSQQQQQQQQSSLEISQQNKPQLQVQQQNSKDLEQETNQPIKGINAEEKEITPSSQNQNKDQKWKLAEKKQDGKQSFEQFKKQLSQNSAHTPQSVSSPTDKPKNFEDYQKQSSKRDESPLEQKKVQESTNQSYISREKQASQSSKHQSPSQRIPSGTAAQNNSKNNTQENELIEQNQKLEQEGLVISDVIDTQDQIETNRNISARQILNTQNSRHDTSPMQRHQSPSISQNVTQEEQVKRNLPQNQYQSGNQDKQDEAIPSQISQKRSVSPKQLSQNLEQQTQQVNSNKLRDSGLIQQKQVETSQQGLKGKYTPRSSESSSPLNSFPNQANSDSENLQQQYNDEALKIEDLQSSKQQSQRVQQNNQKGIQKQSSTSSSKERQKQNLQVDSNLELQKQNQIVVSPNFQQGQVIQSPNFQQAQLTQSQTGKEILPLKQQGKSGNIYEEDQQGNDQSDDFSSDNRLSPLEQKNKDLIKNTQSIPKNNQASTFSNNSNRQSQNEESQHQREPYQQLKQNRTGEFIQQNQQPQVTQNTNRTSRSPSTSRVSPHQATQQNVSPKINNKQGGQMNNNQQKSSQVSIRGERSNLSPRMSQENIIEQQNGDSSFEQINEILNEKREQVQQQQKNTDRNRIASIVSNMNNSSNNITQLNPTGTLNTQNIPTVQTSYSPRSQHQGSQNYNIYTQVQQDAVISPRIQQNSQQSFNQRTSRGNSQTSLPLIPPEIQDEKYRVLRESALGSIVQKKEERDSQVFNLVKNSGYSSPNPSFHQQVQEEELRQQQSQNLNRQFEGEEESNSDVPSNLRNSLNQQSIYSTGLLKQNSPSRKMSNSLSQLQQQPQQILNESELTGNINNSNYTGGFESASQSQSGVNNQNAALAKEIMRRSANLRDQEKLIHKDKDKFLQKSSRSNSQNSNSIHQSLQSPQQNNVVFNSQVGQVSAILDERSQISGAAFMGSQSIPFNDNSQVFANQENLHSQNLKNSQNQQYAQHPLQQAIQNIGGSIIERQELQNESNNFTTLTQSGNKQAIPRVHSRNVSRSNVALENDQIQSNDQTSQNEQEEIDPTNIYQAYRMKNPRSSSSIGQNISPKTYVEHANMNQAIQEQQYIEKVQTINEEQKRLQNLKQQEQQYNPNAQQSSNDQVYENQSGQFAGNNQDNKQSNNVDISSDEELDKEYATIEEAQQALMRSQQRKLEKFQNKKQEAQQRKDSDEILFYSGIEESQRAKQDHISHKEHEDWLRKQEVIEKEQYKQKQQQMLKEQQNKQKTPQQQLYDHHDDQLESQLHQQAEQYLQNTYGDKLNLNQNSNNQNKDRLNKQQDKSANNSQNPLSNQGLGSDQKSSSLQISQSQNKNTSSEITFLNSNQDNSGHKDDKEIQSATFAVQSNNQQASSPIQQKEKQNSHKQQNEAVPTFGDYDGSSQRSTSRKNSLNQNNNESKFKQEDQNESQAQRDFSRKNSQQNEQFNQSRQQQQKQNENLLDDDFVYLSNSNQIKKSPPGSIYQIIEKQKQDIEQNKQMSEQNKKATLLPVQQGQKLSFQDYKSQQNPNQQHKQSPTFNQMPQEEQDQNSNKQLGSQHNYNNSVTTCQFNNPVSLQNSQLGIEPHSEDPQYDLDLFRIKPNQNKQRQENSKQEFGRESFGNNNEGDILSDEQIIQNFNENIAPRAINKQLPPNSNSSRGKTIAQAYEESSEAHNTSYYSQHFQKTEESLDDNSIQNYSQFRPFYDKAQGDESSAININYTPDKQNASRTQFSANQFQTSYYQSPSMNLSRGYKQASLDPLQIQGNRQQLEQLIASQRAQTERNFHHSASLNDNKSKGFQSDRNENEHKSFGDYKNQKTRDQVIAELYQKEVGQMQQNVLQKIYDHSKDISQSFSKSRGSDINYNPFLKSTSNQKDMSILDKSIFNKLSSEKQICVVIAMKLEKFQLKRKFHAFQNMKVKTQMATKRESFSNMHFRQKQQIAKVIYQTLQNNLKKQYLDFFIRLRKNLILQNVNMGQYSQRSQQQINSQDQIDFKNLTREQQFLYHSIGHFSKTINKLKQGRLRNAFDQILYSYSSLRPTIDQNQFFLSQRNQNLRQPIFYTDGNEVSDPQTPERKSRSMKNNKGLQRATSDSPERLAKIQQQVRNSQKQNSFKQPLQLHKMNEDEQQYQQDNNNQSFSENQANNEPFNYSNKQSQQLGSQIENLYFSKKTTDSQASIRQIYNLNDHSKGYKFQMNEFESNLESPHDRNTEDNDYRPQYAPAYADPKEFQPDTQYIRNLSQDDLLLIEELYKNNNANPNLLRPLTGSQYQQKHQSHGSRMDYSDFDQHSQHNEQEKHQFEKYLNQFNLSMSQNQSISHTPYQQPYQSNNLRNSASLKQHNLQNLYNVQIADYQVDDDNSLNQGEPHHMQNQQFQHSYTLPTEQMKLLNQSQQYAFIPESLQPGYMHKYANKLLKIPAIVNYTDLRSSMTGDKKMNEQSLNNPPAQYLPGYEKVINAQKQAIAKSFKKLHNEKVTGKEISLNPNQSLMNSTSVLSPSQRGLMSSQSMYITNLNQSSYQSPRQSMVAMNASNRLYGIAVQKQQQQQQQQQSQQQSTTGSKRLISPDNKSYSLRRSGGQFN
ncbi:chromosome condensation regulator repeat protein (macronuclear) [Tetrahymena thermophila SB210]|uniref:Chromosome condensation regulator repeat protein n=1 Tax=Tetrahymena thermophila (strain SB210) TaxID=312017 RepID=Q22R49_TETTS|nr:chromosome condensation regulator repeat protein [Tetrahymena thermophila SB210]EAR88273.2 chromosome condensation regulator repeat protein [Tetrahymena thermophila SB210]|eukprot:XP_001008518.2 chromosome condensation regulator repeat protein [Tetrahymena thermophila SB210]